jgi:hypothetical protein
MRQTGECGCPYHAHHPGMEDSPHVGCRRHAAHHGPQGMGHHPRGHHGPGHGFRRFPTREEIIAQLEEYLKQLQAEAKGVEEHIEKLKKGEA